MQRGFRIARVLGIDIRIDWSWLLIFVLVSWNLVSVFGQIHSSWAFSLQLTVALAAALLFFASVLAHELAHSLAARAQGVSVRSITLHLFGGVSNIQRHPPSPAAEFVITVVGPITSLVLGLLFTLLSGAGLGPVASGVNAPSRLLEGLGPVPTLLLWLGPVNILLGVFNLIPGFPLDGGRLLRASLWQFTGSLKRATRWASWVGQGVAWLLIFAGFAMAFGVRLPILGTGFLNGLWLAFIGWFLNSASARSYQQILVRDVLEGVQVSKMMRQNPPTISPGRTVSHLVHSQIMGTDDHAFPVMEAGDLVGMVTLEDVRQVSQDRWATTTVRDIMTPVASLATVGAEDEADEALDRLRRADVRQLPVLSEGQLAGLLRRRDIVRWLQLQSEIQAT